MSRFLNFFKSKPKPASVDFSKPVPAKKAGELIRAGNAPAGMRVRGALSFANDKTLKRLPEGLTVNALDLSGCVALEALPANLRVRRLNLSGAWNPEHLLPGLSCYELDLSQTHIASIPATMRVEYRLNCTGCAALRSLPEGLKIGSLTLRDCVSLEALPEGLSVYFIDISGCTAIEHWPNAAKIEVGRLSRGCAQLRGLPPWLTSLAQLDLRDCSNIRELPENLRVSSWIDIAGTRIRALPPDLANVQLRWRGVAVDQRIAFNPETITAEEILNEANVERRRILLERMGYEFFLQHSKAEVLDEDSDAGGPRRLFKVPMKNDEDLVCVSVKCPSTGRQYVIRVPPTMTTCRQAIAWVGGFEDADDYKPAIET